MENYIQFSEEVEQAKKEGKSNYCFRIYNYFTRHALSSKRGHG